MRRLEIEVCPAATGVPFKRFECPVLPAPGVPLSGFCARELALAGIGAHPEGLLTRILSVEADGERVLAEFIGKALLPAR